MHGSLNVLLGIGVITPFNQAVGTILLAKQKWKTLYSIQTTGLCFNISLVLILVLIPVLPYLVNHMILVH